MTIDELNARVLDGSINEFIRVCEARQVKALSKIADDICARPQVRLVLLAGASSAGKTTTAKRLCTQLRVNGAEAVHFSTDDYFVGDRRNPRGADGAFDYEHVDCVDREMLARNLNALFAGGAIRPRRFDFLKHEGYDARQWMRLPPDGFVVLEGIHALNPLVGAGVAAERTFRVFVEPQPRLEVFARTRLSSADTRLLRRLVRDRAFRRIPPAETLRMWPKVLAGEKLWIEPFRGNADVLFDSGLDYETAVIKPFVQGLLERVRRHEPENVRVETLSELLDLVEEASPNVVPGDSILRETIGSSQLEY